VLLVLVTRSWSWWLVDPLGRRVSGQGGRCCTHRVRTTLSTPVAKYISRRRGGGCRNRACQVRSWSFEGADLDLEVGGRLDRFHIRRVHLWWVSRWIRRLLVMTGARCPLTKPVVTAVELQATTEPHCSRGVQPGGICVHVVQREPTPGGPGRDCPQAACASCASCRSSCAKPNIQKPEDSQYT
jgi:hypothetical protein